MSSQASSELMIGSGRREPLMLDAYSNVNFVGISLSLRVFPPLNSFPSMIGAGLLISEERAD